MRQYMVVRDFGGLIANSIIPESEFHSPQRIRELINQRYIVEADSQNEPVSTLAGMRIADLRETIGSVIDVDMITEALESEERATAKTLLQARLKQLTDGDNS